MVIFDSEISRQLPKIKWFFSCLLVYYVCHLFRPLGCIIECGPCMLFEKTNRSSKFEAYIEVDEIDVTILFFHPLIESKRQEVLVFSIFRSFFFLFTLTVKIKGLSKLNPDSVACWWRPWVLEAETAWVQISALPLAQCGVKLLHFSAPPAHQVGKRQGLRVPRWGQLEMSIVGLGVQSLAHDKPLVWVRHYHIK